MTTATTVRTVADALGDVERWKADEQARHAAELVEVDQEIGNLTTAIGNLQQQLEALRKFKEELQGKQQALGGQEIARAHESLFKALQAQSQALVEREAIVAERDKARRADLEASLSGTEIGPLLEEYKQFKTTVEPTLGALPESYRSVILQHHRTLAARLESHVRKAISEPVQVEAAPLEVELVFAVDAPEGKPELLILVLPVTDQVQSGWVDREDSLQLWLAARVVQGVYEAAAKTGFVAAQAMSGGHLGLLALELDLSAALNGAAFVDAVQAVISERLAGAPELAGARVAVRARKVDVDYVLPPEDDEEASDAG